MVSGRSDGTFYPGVMGSDSGELVDASKAGAMKSGITKYLQTIGKLGGLARQKKRTKEKNP